jgi:hypothetical protein
VTTLSGTRRPRWLRARPRPVATYAAAGHGWGRSTGGARQLTHQYMKGRPELADPVLAGPLHESGLLHVLEPETLVDQDVTEHLAEAMTELITRGAFDDLPTTGCYAELSRSRMGWNADVKLAEMLVEELQARDLARPSQDGVSVPLHPVVRTVILVLLSQLMRDAGHRAGLDLHPTTSRPEVLSDLLAVLSLPQMPSAGHVVALDLEVVSLNLAPVPPDEILGFRQEHGAAYRAYARNIRELIGELALLDSVERQRRLLDRREELADSADSLRATARREWRLPLASFAMGAAGAVWALSSRHDPVTAALSIAGGVLGAASFRSAPASAYSYLIDAQRQLGPRASRSVSGCR